MRISFDLIYTRSSWCTYLSKDSIERESGSLCRPRHGDHRITMDLLLYLTGLTFLFTLPSDGRQLPKCRDEIRILGIHGTEQGQEEEPEKRRKDEYRLEVKNSGPAVLDSIIDFSAKLFNTTGHLADSTMFQYVWNNNADYDELMMEDNFFANLTKVYSFVDPNRYTMQVCVYAKDKIVYRDKVYKKLSLVAKGETKFILTSSLNGQMKLKQQLNYQKSKKILATNTPVHFSVNVTDKFEYKMTSYYQWYHGHTLMTDTQKPEYTFIWDRAESLMKLAVNVGTYKDGFLKKNGQWSQSVQFKDVIGVVNVSEDSSRSVDVHDSLNLTVSYQASNPTVVCWEVCQANKNISYCGNSTCGFPVTGDRKWYRIHLVFTQVGRYYVRIKLQNDVSQKHLRSRVVTVYNTEDYHSERYTIPVIFICLGVFLVAGASIFILRWKKKPHVETADFDFHPTLNRNESHPFIHSIKRSIGLVFQPKRKCSSFSQARTTARRYGSLEDEYNPL